MRKNYLYLIVLGLAVCGFVFYRVQIFRSLSITMYSFVMELLLFTIAGLILFATFLGKITGGGLTDFNFGRYVYVLDLLVLGFSILAIYSFVNAIYTKPLSYYIFVSIPLAILGLQIIHGKGISEGGRERILLVQIFTLAFIIRISTPLINPYLTGHDVHDFSNWTNDILNNGQVQLPTWQHYLYYPADLIEIASLRMIAFLSLEASLIVSHLVPNILQVLIIFFVGKKMFNTRIGLMCSLLLTMLPLHILGSNNNSPMFAGIMFLLLSLYALVKHEDLGFKKAFAIFWLSAIGVFFTHAVLSVVLALMLAANYFVKKLFFLRRKMTSKKFTPFLSYLIGLVSYWMFIYVVFFEDIVNIIFLQTILSPLAQKTSVSVSPIFYLEISLNYLGVTMLAFFGLVGALMWLFKPNAEKLAVILSIFFLNLIPLFALITGSFPEPTRFLVFMTLLLVFPAAVGLVTLLRTINTKKVGMLVSLAVLLLYSFTSVASYLTWDNNGLFTKEVPMSKNYIAESTLALESYLKEIPKNNKIYTTFPINMYLFSTDHYSSSENIYNVRPGRGLMYLPRQIIKQLSHETAGDRGIFLVNIPSLKGGTYSGEEMVKYTDDFFEKFSNMSLWYDNGMNQLYENKG